MPKYTSVDVIDTDGTLLKKRTYLSGRVEYYRQSENKMFQAYKHRLGGPAVIFADGGEQYWVNGVPHIYETWKKVAENLEDRSIVEDTKPVQPEVPFWTYLFSEDLEGVFVRKTVEDENVGNEIMNTPMKDLLRKCFPEADKVFYVINERGFTFAIPDYVRVDHRATGFWVHLNSGDTVCLRSGDFAVKLRFDSSGNRKYR